MKRIITIITVCVMCGGILAAERLRLKYAATVTVIDDAGRKIGTRQLKAGTEIAVVDAAADAQKGDAEAKSTAGKPSGISPAQFIAERITTPTKFVAVGTLDPDPVTFNKSLSPSTHWCASLGIFGKTRKSQSLVYAYAPKSSIAGKSLFKIMKDGEQHKLLVSIKGFVNSKHPEEVELTDIKELSDDDPLIKALMATEN